MTRRRNLTGVPPWDRVRVEAGRASASANGLVAATDRRVLWRELDDRGRSEPREIRLDDVVAAEGVSEHHRWRLELEHGPIERITHVQLLTTRYGDGGRPPR
jgi:hypothetical protein